MLNKKQRILIICHTMSYFSGSPLYHYTLAKELKKQGHDVAVYSVWAENELKQGLVDMGIMTFYHPPVGEVYDLILISQPDFKHILKNVFGKKVFNIIHSQYEVESPIEEYKIDKYIAIRPEIKNHLIFEHHIPSEMIEIIYNGIDFGKFSPEKRSIHEGDFVKVVLPCTLDLLRKKFIEYYTKRANERFRVYLYGKDYGNEIYKNEWTFLHKETFKIEECIADADFVAGILLGRVNLEARAMGIVSFIHDPEHPEKINIFYPQDHIFEENHNIENVAKKIINLTL